MSASLHHHAVGLTWVETGAMARASHALHSAGHVWLVDPFDDEPALTAAARLGQTAAVIQLLDRHNRDCEEIARRLDVPLLRLPASVAGGPFAVIPVIRQRLWNELALWWPEERTLIVAEAVGTSPLFALGRRVGVHPMLRALPPGRALRTHDPERLLVGHGPPVEAGAGPALADALAHARSDLPKLLLKLPAVLRGNQ